MVLGLVAAAALLIAAIRFPAWNNAEPQPAGAPPETAPAYREITWDDLLPKDWDPMQAFKGLDFSKLGDNDPKAIKALRTLKNVWDNAPIETSLDGQSIRLAGFAIPLDSQNQHVSEALLVPYFGACIHSPPPPANQVIHVVFKTPVKDMRTMDAFWIGGVLTGERGDSGLGVHGYRLAAERVEPYVFDEEKP
ncbi:MAG: DUF3299 domain-containing protein [Candidatus Accumulibacter sp.]|nr:DUF3299 domain-containing protein [Accumulibacter sp.]